MTDGVASRFEEFLRALNGVLRVSQLYPRGHQSVVSGLARAYEELRGLLARRQAVHLGVLGEEMVFDDGETYPSSGVASYLVKVLKDHGIDRVAFSTDCTVSDLGELVDVLLKEPEELQAAGGIQRALQTRGVRSITLERIVTGPLKPKEEEPWDESLHSLATGLMVRARTGLDTLMEEVQRQRPLVLDPTRAFANDLARAVASGEKRLLSLAFMARHEDKWLVHLVRVTALCTAFGRRAGLNQAQIEAMATASFLYDVGLMALGLTRDAPSHDTRYRAHPVEGARLLLQGREVHKLSVVVAFEHHMGHDLSGFPRVAGKTSVHPVAELVGLADEYVTLVSGHHGQKKLRSDEAILQLAKGVGKTYDPALFASFVAMVGVFSPGSFVELSDGRCALVVALNRGHFLRPVVRVITDEAGRFTERGQILDLKDVPGVTILRAFDPRERGIDPSPFLRSLMGRGYRPFHISP